jgi:hypothetical protein
LAGQDLLLPTVMRTLQGRLLGTSRAGQSRFWHPRAMKRPQETLDKVYEVDACLDCISSKMHMQLKPTSSAVAFKRQSDGWRVGANDDSLYITNIAKFMRQPT